MKRLLDIAISLTAILLFLPFGLIIAVILRLTGEGEVFYVQQRVGKDGRLFGLIKFVTMLKDSPNVGTRTVTVKDDPRVLPVGWLLRKAKLNEVPQLLNVLKGDMSIVGPRPLTPETFQYYPLDIQRQIVKVKPGLTGIGSIVFRDEESIVATSSKSTIDCYKEDVAPYKGLLELWYIANRNVWLDLKLIFLTILVVVNPHNMLYKRMVPGLPQHAALALTGGKLQSCQTLEGTSYYQPPVCVGTSHMKVVNVVGARPNFMKIAPLMAQYKSCTKVESLLVHTGQHYDQRMSPLFFSELEIPEPDINLEVGSASHAVQTAEIMKAFEPIVLEYKPDFVVVVGDVNSTIACGLVAVKLGIKIVHVEAGLRSFDRSMPEEINRVLTDSISDLLFCTEQSGVDNLLREGIAQQKVFLVGNLMIDTLVKNKKRASKSAILSSLHLDGDDFAVLTLHRPSNVDEPAVLGQILDALEFIQSDMPIVFPVHPRTCKNLQDCPFGTRIKKMHRLRLIQPLGYLDFLKLLSSARIVLTDSGGIQEETTFLKVPCLTLRESTERPITVQIGSNTVVGTDTDRIVEAYKQLRNGHMRDFQIPALWDGHAAERIVKILHREYEQRKPSTPRLRTTLQRPTLSKR